jgi:hypothetical protein
MRGTALPRFVSSIALVAALSLIAVGCGDDRATGDSTVTQTDDSPAETAATVVAPGDDVETTTGSVDETTTGSVDETDNSEVSMSSPEVTDDSTSDPDVSVEGHTSDDLQEYIDSLAATTDNFDGLTTTSEESTCAATAVLTPIGIEVLQSHDVTVENVDQELDVLEFASPDAAAGIADGLVKCGLGPRFASSFGESEAAEDLDGAGQLALRDCLQAKLDDETARSLLTGYLTPSTGDETYSPERTEAGSQMAGMVRDCGVKSRFYP